jgi:hypothetical protein
VPCRFWEGFHAMCRKKSVLKPVYRFLSRWKQTRIALFWQLVFTLQIGDHHFFLSSESIAAIPLFGPIVGHKWFDQISSQWKSQKNRFGFISFWKIQFIPPCIWNLPFMSYRLRSCLTASEENQAMRKTKCRLFSILLLRGKEQFNNNSSRRKLQLQTTQNRSKKSEVGWVIIKIIYTG